MKYFLLLATCCLTVECQAQNNWFIPRVWRWFTGGPSYYTVNQLPAGFDRLDVTELDDTFDTYVRMICKEQKNVGDGNFSAPCNCSDSLLPGRKRDTVETEIMLVSDTYNQVIVINYLKNKREKVYTDAIRPRIGPGLGPKSYANVNIFKLNQIRFGTLKGSMGDTLYFRVNSKDGREEYWDLRRKEIHQEVVAVRTAEIDGFEYKATQAAMVMPPFYERHGGANICFQRVRLRDNKALGDSMLLKDNKIYVDKRDKSVYFVFQHPDGKEQVIKFKSNRLYSYYQLLPGCQECSPNFLCTGFLYDRFSLEKRKIISDNWYEFAGENLEAPFPCGEASVKSMALRLDGVGCVYPAKVNNNNLQSLFLDDRVSRKNVRARTFYSLMRNHNGALDFRNDSSFYSDLKGNIEPYARRPLRSSDTFLLKFRQQWNHRYLTQFADEMKKTIEDNKIRRVVFFIHGYNVPNSIAHLQGNDLIRDFMAECRQNGFEEKVLFVRVFWPCNDAKTLRFKKNGCSINDDMEPMTGQVYNYITNTAYLTSLSIRELMRGMDTSLQVNIISHSFGAAVAAGTVLHPVQKMKDTCSHLNKFFLRAFTEIPPLPQKTTFFMNAPGMPGVTTFNTISPALNTRHYFYVGYNEKDRVQRKRLIGPFGIKPYKNNSTTLGCNYKNEVGKTTDSVKTRAMDGHFLPFRTSTRTVHDYFCYRQQEGFKKAFHEYVKKSYSAGIH